MLGWQIYCSLAVAQQEGIDVHICPHSHMDVGFVWTPDTMFGRNASEVGIGKDRKRLRSVGVMLDAVVDALQQDPRRTYNMAEIFFFDLWMQNKSATERAAVLDLVRALPWGGGR